MEIFQTIWTALTTENELLTNIVLIPLTFSDNFVGMLIFSILLNISSSTNTKIKYILTVSSLCSLSILFIPNPYRSFINLILLFICIKFFFKTNILKTIFAIIVPIFFNVLLESMMIKISSSIINFNSLLLLSVPLYRIIVTLILHLSMLIIYLLIKYSKFQISMFESMSKKGKRILIPNILLAFLAISVQFIIIGFYLERLPIYIVIFSNLSLIAYFVLSIYSLTKTTQLELTSLNLEQEKENNKILKDMQDELRGFRHDFSNIMCTIGGYVQVKDMEGLTKYYYQIEKDVTKINNLGNLNSDVINNPAIFVLISSKYSKALELGIEMNINIFLDLNNLNMKIYEFTRVLGILLDNAIEAAKECNDKVINIEIRKDSKRNRQLLIIENTYSNKDVNIDKIFEKKYSTKEGNSGLGLWEVRQILKKNNNLNLFTTKNDNFFKQQLEMYNM